MAQGWGGGGWLQQHGAQLEVDVGLTLDPSCVILLLTMAWR